MSKVDDSGTAFPGPKGIMHEFDDDGKQIGSYVTMYNVGMSLRDYFAAKAMQGLVFQLSGVEVFHCDKTGLAPVYDEGEPAAGNKRVADWAYLIADAMLAARKAPQ